MISRLRGAVLERGAEHVVVDCAGVGYHASCSLRSMAACPPVGEPIDLYTHLVIREDEHLLYGFATEGEREAFRLLLLVNGVGPRLAMAICSGLSPQELCDAVVHGEVARFKGISGVGKKTAERVVLDLRDRVDKLQAMGGAATPAGVPRAPAVPGVGRTLDELRSALENLGYRAGEIERALDAVRPDAVRGVPVQELLREALRATRART